MKLFLTACFALCLQCSFAQKTVNVDNTESNISEQFFTVNGEAFVNTRYVRLKEGTPYFKDEWMKAVVYTDNNERSRTSRAKLDLINNELHFLNDKDEEMVCTSKLKKVNLFDTVHHNNYTFVYSTYFPALANASKGWYLQLVDGKTSLFQYFDKLVHENKGYASSITEQTISTSEQFFIGYNGALFQVKKPKDVPAILANKQKELEEYLKNANNKGKSNAEQLIAMITYYISLLP